MHPDRYYLQPCDRPVRPAAVTLRAALARTARAAAVAQRRPGF